MVGPPEPPPGAAPRRGACRRPGLPAGRAGACRPGRRRGGAFLGHRHLARGRAAMDRRRFPRHEGRPRGASRVRLLGERDAGDLRSGGPTALLGRGPMASHRAYADVPPARSRPSRRLRRRWPAPARVRRRGPASMVGRDDGATCLLETAANRGRNRRPRHQPRRPYAGGRRRRRAGRAMGFDERADPRPDPASRLAHP
jgi:hypothetical protein